MRRLDASSAMHSLENRRNLSRQSSDNKIDILSQQGLENSSELIRHSTDIKSGLVRRASENKRTNLADTNDADNQSLDNRLTSLAESRDRWTPDQSGSGSGSVAGAAGSNNLEYEKRLRQLR